MTLPAPTYDLVLLLDPQADDGTRAKLVADARGAIEAQGEFLRHDNWGDRALAYPIDRKSNAEYHLLQFHAGTPELLAGLNRSLRIADEVLRFRIIKLAPGVPDAPDMSAGAAAARRSEAEGQPAADAPPAPVAEPAPQPAAETAPQAPAEAAPRPAAEAAGDAEAELAVGEPS
jgi:small subunit ribosomal protein S6